MSKKPAEAVRPSPNPPILTVVDDEPVTTAPVIETIAPIQTNPTTITTTAQGKKTMMNSTVDFAAIGKENLEAFTASSKIWTAGVKDLSTQFAATAKASLEESVATFKALATVKSVKEAIELQTAYSKAAVTKALAESSKLTEASLKLAEQAMAPLTARIAATVGSMSKVA